MPNEVNITENISKATEVAFCFDTTGSMQGAIKNVREHLEKTVEQMFEIVPELKVGLIAHGDYCDSPPYEMLPLTNNRKDIYDFIRNAKNTGGGDIPECYELALNVAKNLGWSDSKGGKILVLIGDAEPHDTSYHLNTDKLDWKKELTDLKERGIDVYPLQCLYKSYAIGPNSFWSYISETFNTPLLKLNDFAESAMTLTAAACSAAGTDAYEAFEEKIVKSAKGLSANFCSNSENMKLNAAKYDTYCPKNTEVKAKDERK